jgi:Icc-related predicted phosphoesterase
LKFLIFSDIHGDLRALERLLAQQADIYISAGDLSNFGRGLDRCGELFRPFAERVWVIPGNHETQEESSAFCEKYGLIDFHRRVRTAGANPPSAWAGLGYSNPTPFNTPGEYSEEEIAEALAEFEEARPPYLVAHCPPQNTKLDEFAPGKHGGSRAVREWVERVQPAYVFSGHIHECAGRSDVIGATRCLNVGKAGYLLEI